MLVTRALKNLQKTQFRHHNIVWLDIKIETKEHVTLSIANKLINIQFLLYHIHLQQQETDWVLSSVLFITAK